MKSIQSVKLIFYLSIFLISLQSASGDIFEECEGLEDGTFIPGSQGCKSYIYCEGEESYEGFCPTQLLFNQKDGSCAPEDEVECSDEVATTTEQPIETERTTKSSSTTASSTPSQTKAETDEPVDETTKSQQQTSTTLSPVQPTTGSVVSTPSPVQVCPTSDDPYAVILLPSETSCSEYFICYHGTPVQMMCSGQLLFDYVTLKCELPIRAKCKAPIQTTPNPRTECVHNTNDFYPYPKNCNYFYKCMNGFLSLQQCPVGFGWSEEMKLCLKLDNGRCPRGGRDQFQNQSWLNSVYSI